MKPTNLSRHLDQYLTAYLPGTKGLSYNTIASHRDAFVLLFSYLREARNLKPEKTEVTTLDRETVIAFLDWIEAVRGCGISTRNIRLSAIKAFFSYLQLQTPDYIYQCQQIMAIPPKKCPEKGLEYLTLDGVKAILDSIDAETKSGLRDLTLLSVMYDSAARVQEVADLCVNDVRFEKPSTLRLTGKGRKTRIIPIMEPTVVLIRRYIREFHGNDGNVSKAPLFYNHNKSNLTRAGIAYILSKYVTSARRISPVLIPETVSPHGLRHSKSMHMLQAGVPLIYIRDYLGHAEISTTEIYARCDSAQKRLAIEAAYPEFRKNEVPEWHSDGSLMDWLKSLC